MTHLTCGFIGLGLIGGSIARALKEKLPDTKIIAYDINPDTLIAARESNVADITTSTIDENFRTCDYLFLCAPVQKNDENLKAVKAVLLENAYYILTPTKEVPAEKVQAYRQLVQTLGAIPLVLTSEQHDYVTAAVSHLPHIIAAALVNLVHDHDSAEGIMKMIAAGGFKDITRIASSSATMWQQICLTNTENISQLLGDYISSLTQIKTQLDEQNAISLYDLFDSARIYRDSFINTASGPIKSSYSINVEIEDTPGALASIATTLAQNNISIKNIGIVHNREFEGGVLRIEFYEEDSIAKANTLLSLKGFHIHAQK